MAIQITPAGKALLQSGTPPVITRLVLGSAFGYSPTPDQTGLQGSQVYVQNNVWPPVSANPSTLKYIFEIPTTQADVTFGEFALYVGTTLFAIAGFVDPSVKPASKTHRIDVFVSLDQANAASYEQSSGYAQESFPQVPTVDSLPLPTETKKSVWNVYSTLGNSFIAYSDPNGIWTFDTRRNKLAQGTVASVGVQGIQSPALVNLSYPGPVSDLIIQFINGKQRGLCRQVSVLTAQGGLTWVTPVNSDKLPEVSDSFVLFSPAIGSGPGSPGPTGPTGIQGPTGPAGSGGGGLTPTGPLFSSDSSQPLVLTSSIQGKFVTLGTSIAGVDLAQEADIPDNALVSFTYNASFNNFLPNISSIEIRSALGILGWTSASDQYVTSIRIKDGEEMTLMMVNNANGRHWAVQQKFRDDWYETFYSSIDGPNTFGGQMDSYPVVLMNGYGSHYLTPSTGKSVVRFLNAGVGTGASNNNKRSIYSQGTYIEGISSINTSEVNLQDDGDSVDFIFNPNTGNWRAFNLNVGAYRNPYIMLSWGNPVGPSSVGVSSLGSNNGTQFVDLWAQLSILTRTMSKGSYNPAGEFVVVGQGDSGYTDDVPNQGKSWVCKETGLYELDIMIDGIIGSFFSGVKSWFGFVQLVGAGTLNNRVNFGGVTTADIPDAEKYKAVFSEHVVMIVYCTKDVSYRLVAKGATTATNLEVYISSGSIRKVGSKTEAVTYGGY